MRPTTQIVAVTYFNHLSMEDIELLIQIGTFFTKSYYRIRGYFEAYKLEIQIMQSEDQSINIVNVSNTHFCVQSPKKRFIKKKKKNTEVKKQRNRVLISVNYFVFDYFIINY